MRYTRFTLVKLESSGAGIKARGGQQMRLDQWTPVLEKRRLPSRLRRKGGLRERRARGQLQGGSRAGGRAVVPVCGAGGGGERRRDTGGREPIYTVLWQEPDRPLYKRDCTT